MITYSTNSSIFKSHNVFFWICLLCFYDPGGIQKLITEGPDLFGRFDWMDLLFPLLILTYLLTKNKRVKIVPLPKPLMIFLWFWLVYYYLVVGMVIPQSYSLTSFLNMFFKTRDLIYAIVLMYPINYFTQKSFSTLIWYNQRITILISFLFVITIVTGIELVYVVEGFREFAGVTRYLIQGRGFMEICMFSVIVILILGIKTPSRQIIVAGISYFIIILLAVTRRDFVEIPVVILFLFFFRWKVFRIKFFSLKILFALIYVIIGLFILFLFIPKYIASLELMTSETAMVVRGEVSSSGWKDNRLSLDNEFILSIIEGNERYGTGFDIKWYEGEQQKLGYETSDHPFLASFAMLGYVGFIFFSPFYYFLLYYFYLFYLFSKNNRIKISYLLETNKIFLSIYVLSLATLCLCMNDIFNYTYLFACSGTHPIYNIIYFYFAMFWGCFNLLKKGIVQYEQ